MTLTTELPTNSEHPACQQRILRLPARWRLVFLSTGEVTLESHLASIGKRVKAGQQVRVIDISADAGTQMGVFNHSHGMNAADLTDHLKQQSRQHYGSLAANEDQQAIRQVRSFIEQHGESRFTPKQTGYSSQVRQRAGWIDVTGPQTLYLFYPTGWREATEGLSPDRAAKALMAAGYLVPDGNRPQCKVSLPDNTRPRMYCVKGSILDD